MEGENDLRIKQLKKNNSVKQNTNSIVIFILNSGLSTVISTVSLSETWNVSRAQSLLTKMLVKTC